MSCILSRCSILIILLMVVTGIHANAMPFTLREVLDYPFMGNLIADERHDQIAWVQNYQGVRNIWIAEGPTFTPHPVTSYDQDDGQELTQLAFAPDGRHLSNTGTCLRRLDCSRRCRGWTRGALGFGDQGSGDPDRLFR